MKFSIKDFSSKCDQIPRKLRIWSHLLQKSLMENFIFYAVYILINEKFNDSSAHSCVRYLLIIFVNFHKDNNISWLFTFFDKIPWVSNQKYSQQHFWKT